VRDEVVDFVNGWSEKTELAVNRMTAWLGVSSSKFHDWRRRYGKVNEHNARVPRDHWLEEWEKQAILDFDDQHRLEGYRRQAFMMLDADLVAVSPSSVYRVLKAAGRLQRWNRRPSRKGTGFVPPLQAHEHWHVDVSYINVCGTFYYLCSLLDGYSRSIVHWEIRESMKEAEVEVILQRAREKFPAARPRIISDNGPQFIARDFKEFIRLCGMTHVRTSPYYPQSNGKLERWHKSLKSECIRPGTPLSLQDARRIIERYVAHYNTVRLHSAIGYVTPADKLAGRESAIFAERDRKLEAARQRRSARREAMGAGGSRGLGGVEVRITGPALAIRCHGLADRGLEPPSGGRDNGGQPAKRKRALEASNPPGIAGRVCDEWSRGRSIDSAPTPLHHSEHSLMPQKTQSPNGEEMCVRRVALLSNSR
jgi:transposase InsO family protein